MLCHITLLTRVLVDDVDRVDVARYEGAAGVIDPVHMISDMALHAIVSPGEGRLGGSIILAAAAAAET